MVITSKNKRPKFRPYGSTQLRFALTFVVITGIVLLFLNIYCSEFSQRLFYESKQRSMVEKAQLVANEIGSLDVMTPSGIDAAIEKVSQLSVSRLVVTDQDGNIIYDSDPTSMPEPQMLAQVQDAMKGYRLFNWQYHSGVMRSEAAVPIVSYNVFSGCVYMLETDAEMGQLLQTLMDAIFTVTLLLEVGLLIFAVIYAYQFSRRLRKIMASMDIIQDGNYDHKVRLGGHDELSILGNEFNDLTERLQISENKRRQFVSDASHELKTPLASIKLLSDSILQYDMDQQTVREFVSDIGNEADRLTRMTTKLLALTKGERNNDLADAEIIYMAPTLQRVAKMLSSLASENNVTIETDLSTDSQVLIQEDDLYQIAFNLAENGIKYNVPGGKLSISLHRQEDNAILRVSDTGMGIPPEAIGHVFERFYRVDKARSRQSGGSGLGLAIVRSIVERNNGQIHLQSTLGKGTVFTVEFPLFDIDDEEEHA